MKKDGSKDEKNKKKITRIIFYLAAEFFRNPDPFQGFLKCLSRFKFNIII